MRNAILSISLGLVGLVFISYINYSYYEAVNKFKGTALFNPHQFTISITSKVGMLLLGFLALYYSFKSISTHKAPALVGAFLGLVVVLLSFMPIYLYFL